MVLFQQPPKNLASGTEVFYDDETSREKPIHGGKRSMRFDKKSRKIRVKKKKKKNARITASFWGYVVFAVVLLGIFYVLLYSAHKKGLRRTRQEKIQEDFDRICAGAVLHAQEHGTFPSTEQGIAALVKKVVKPSTPGGSSVSTGTLERMPLDPWRNPYAYRGSARADEITLISWGADGMQGGTGEAADVIRKGCRSTALPLR
jgi:general secretion pathway protein G